MLSLSDLLVLRAALMQHVKPAKCYRSMSYDCPGGGWLERCHEDRRWLVLHGVVTEYEHPGVSGEHKIAV